MIGDAQDMAGRLRAVLPTRWFSDQAPVLGGMLAGIAQMASANFGQIDYARAQTRIMTASGVWLDLIAVDFFGLQLTRGLAEADAAFRARILAAMFPPRATRAAAIAAVAALGVGSPTVFEPMRPADTGAWNLALGYGVAGGWGSLTMPFQALIQLPATVKAGPSLMALAAVLPAAATAWTRPVGPALIL